MEKSVVTRMREESGFTLIEIMVVVAIIGLLIGAVAFNVGKTNVQAKKQATSMALDSLDSALERFRMDFNCYPTIKPDGAVANSANEENSEWQLISKAMSAMGLSGGTNNEEKLFSAEFAQVLQASDPQIKMTEPVEIDTINQQYNGPYIRAGKDGIKRDGWKKDFTLWVDNAKGAYKLYSWGENGKDDVGKGDDMVSNGSQLETP